MLQNIGTIFFADSDFLVVLKNSLIPCAPLNENSECLLFEVAKDFPDVLDVKNSKKAIEAGLIHRIDNDTTGLVLIARTQKFYDYIMTIQEDGKFKKTYTAICNFDSENSKKLGGFPLEVDIKNNHITSLFRNFGEGGKVVRPVLVNSNLKNKKVCKNIYTTTIKKIESLSSNVENGKNSENTEKKIITAEIFKGYRHQVRCHLAWLGYPIVNDKLYNADFSKSGSESLLAEALSAESLVQENKMQFYAIGLEFPYFEDGRSKIFCFDCSDQVKRTTN